MNIVLEGPDNSGKSTLAKLLGIELQRPIFSSEGPEKYSGELRERVERYRGLRDVIFDRHPCVSDIIYGAFRERRSSVAGEQEMIFYAGLPLLIYCDPLDRGLDGHIEKAHDSAEHVQMISQRYSAILNLYRTWGIQRAHIIYRIGDDPQRIVRFCREFDPVSDVEAFHRRFNRQYDGAPRVLPPDLAQFREDCGREELDEYIKNARRAAALLEDIEDHIDGDNYPKKIAGRLAEMLDALVDQTYFALGTAHLHGFNFREAWARVHAANMRKKAVVRRGDSTRFSVHDIVKPPDWQPPDHTDLVKNHIHR